MYNLCIWIGLIRRFAVKELVTDKSVVQGDVGSTENSTTLTATISITLDGRNTVCKGSTVWLTYNNVRLTGNIISIRSIDFSSMFAHTSSPATAIDITHLPTFDIGIAAGSEAINMFAIVVKTGSSNTQGISYSSTSTCSIEVLDNSSTQQINIGASINVTTTEDALFYLQ